MSQVEPKRPMIRLFRYLKSYAMQLWFSIFSSISNKILDLMPPFLTAWMIDTVAGNMPPWISGCLGTDDLWSGVIFIAVLILVIFGGESFFEWLFARGFMRLAQNVQHDLRIDAYNKLQQREVAYFEEQRTGNLMAMLNDDVNQLERFLNNGFNEILQIVVLVIFATAALCTVSVELALIGMIPIPFIIFGSIYYQRTIAPHYRNIRETVGELGNRLENNISGILVVKSFTAEKFESKRVAETSEKYRKVNYGAIKYNSLFVPLIRCFIALGFAAVLLLGAYWVMQDNGKMTLGGLALFAMMIQRLLWPVTRLGRIFDEFERARASARRIFSLMDSPPLIQNAEFPVQPKSIDGSITFEHVHFHYNEGQPVLDGLNFPVKAGKRIGIAGITGAGKTTLIKLLLRLYDVNKGRICVDGIDIRDLDIETLRRNIALVSQDVYLFHGTVFENIAYGMEDASQEMVESAARKAQMHDFISGLPEGYNSIVGERGIKLSGGQRQRLSIARAILKDAPILVLDEATSSVDTETERAIQQNLEQLTANRTAIIIAHRLSTIRHADRIIILANGKIEEQGTHQELLSKGGIYADLWNVQLGETV
ncbi:MAG: ABC transporter ATP-binding protein [Bacteroidota bacterium]